MSRCRARNKWFSNFIRGIRCVLPKGHDGLHKAHVDWLSVPIVWDKKDFKRG